MAERIVDIEPAIFSQKLAIILEGEVFQLRVFFNSRTQSWYMDILDTVGTPLLSGLRLVHFFPLLEQYFIGRALPQNSEFYVVDMERRQRDATFDSFGQDVLLFVLEPDEA